MYDGGINMSNCTVDFTDQEYCGNCLMMQGCRSWSPSLWLEPEPTFGPGPAPTPPLL